MIRLGIALILFSFLGFQCASDPVAAGGGDEFPNTYAESLGQNAAGTLRESAYKGDAVALTNSGPEILANANLPISDKGAELGKRIAAQGRLLLDSSFAYGYSDTATGVLRLYGYRLSDSTVRYDTLELVWEGAIPEEGTEKYIAVYGTVYGVYRTSVEDTLWTMRYRIDDVDGDGVVNTGSIEDRARYRQSTVAHGELDIARVEMNQTVIIGPGEDGDYDSESDNSIFSFVSQSSVVGDTLEYESYTDADGDGVPVDGALDSCVVTVHAVKKKFGLNGPIRRTEHTIGYVVFPQNHSRNYPVKYRESVQNRLRPDTTALVVRIDGDSVFYPGDTVSAEMVVAGGREDEIVSDTARMIMVLGSDGTREDDDFLLSVYARSRRRFGEEREIEYLVESEKPFGRGTPPLSGTLEYRVRREDNSSADILATFDSESISAIVTTTRHGKLEIVWDRNGNVIRRSR